MKTLLTLSLLCTGFLSACEYGVHSGALVGSWRESEYNEDGTMALPSSVSSSDLDIMLDDDGESVWTLTRVWAESPGEAAGCIQVDSASGLHWWASSTSTSGALTVSGKSTMTDEWVGCDHPSFDQPVHPATIWPFTPKLDGQPYCIDGNELVIDGVSLTRVH